MKKITVFTPTYNRGYTLNDLYKSLVKQNCKDFIWMIVDDGSTDDTKEIVKKFISENKIEIEYYYQNNQGKHVAHNLGVKKCRTELFFCVDSDDKLTSNAIFEILEIEKEGKIEKNNICGIVGNRCFSDGSIIGTKFPEIEYESLSELYKKGKKGDTSLIYKANVIKKYPFKVFENEKFLRENTAYDEIDKKYKLYVTNQIFTICEYLDDGLSKNAIKIEMKNPLGAAYYRLLEAKKAEKASLKIRNYSGYIFFMIKGKKIKECIKEVGIFRFVFLLPIAFVGAIRYKYLLRGIKWKNF